MGKKEKLLQKAENNPTQKKYSGHFNVRVDKRLHRQLAIEAAIVGLSLNALIAQKLVLSARRAPAFC